MSLGVGADIDRYHVEGVLGEGGMAVVYKVRHRELGTLHAMKVLHTSHPSTAERMLQEGRIQARVRHRNLVAVTDVVRVSGQPALVMEYIDGPPLDVLLYRFQPNLAQVDHLAHGILAGVAHAHAHGLVHRDLKPGNVLVVVDGDEVVPKITDFGLAKVLRQEQAAMHHATRTGVTMGTPAFMAPEQYRDAKSVDERADVFSLGALLYEMVAGAPAFEAGSLVEVYEAMRDERYRPVRDWVPSVPERMARAIEGALAFDVDDRIPSCGALLATWRGEDRGGYAPVAAGNPWEGAHLAAVRKLAAREDKWPELADLHASTLTPSQVTPSREPPVNPTLAPKTAADPPAAQPRVFEPPGPRRRTAALAVLATALAAVGASGILVLALVIPPLLQGEPRHAPRGQLSQEPVPAPVEPAVEPEDQAEIAPEPASEPEPASGPESASEPAPARRSPPPAPPEPAHTVVTVQRRPEPPVAEPEPEPEPGRPPPGHARVRVEGADSAYLVRDDGTRFASGDVPAGTYALVVLFAGTPVTVDDRVPLVDGELRVITCEAMLKRCR